MGELSRSVATARLRELQALRQARGLAPAEWEEVALLLAQLGQADQARQALAQARHRVPSVGATTRQAGGGPEQAASVQWFGATSLSPQDAEHLKELQRMRARRGLTERELAAMAVLLARAGRHQEAAEVKHLADNPSTESALAEEAIHAAKLQLGLTLASGAYSCGCLICSLPFLWLFFQLF